MDYFEIKGPCVLKGEVTVSGSKNATLPILAAALLSKDTSVIKNVPNLSDVHSMLALFEYLGVKTTFEDGTVTIDPSAVKSIVAPYDIVRKMRSSVLVLGPLLAHFGVAKVSLPGGCAIGSRPIDQHLMGLEALGAEIDLNQGYVEARLPTGGLTGAQLTFDMPSVGATEHIMMAASLAQGCTTIHNAAKEPEIVELADFLGKMGVQITGAGSSTIKIEGKQKLHGAEHSISFDRIEAGTLLAAAAITGGNIKLHGVKSKPIEAVCVLLMKAGCEILARENEISIQGPKRLKAVSFQTGPFPEFPTDMQAQMMACMALAQGTSLITENIFENRYMHVSELSRMGADISLEGPVAKVKGAESLSAAPVMATDLRASASLVLAALAAQGTTRVNRIYHLDRGYVGLEKKLALLGGNVTRKKAGLQID